MARVPIPGGPFALIFAHYAHFLVSVPPSAKFTLFGWRLSDKVRRRGPLQVVVGTAHGIVSYRRAPKELRPQMIYGQGHEFPGSSQLLYWFQHEFPGFSKWFSTSS